ncbi:ankyrin [Penicillium lividum]|nr:ankyrin [Penicillium lividum]
MLLGAGVEVNICTQDGEFGTALQAASFRGKMGVVQILLGAGADINAHGGLYGTALQAASSNGQTEIFQMLLNAGADDHSESSVTTRPFIGASQS